LAFLPKIISKLDKIDKIKTKSKNVVVTEKPMPVCTKCGKSNKSDFYMSRNPRYEYYGRIPYCRNCMIEDYDRFFAETSNPVSAMWFTFSKLDIPLMSSALNSIPKETLLNSPIKAIGLYFQRLNLGQYLNYKSFEDTDVLLEDDGGFENQYGEDIDLEYMYLNWGGNKTIKEYLFLESRYDTWLKDVEAEFESDRVLIKRICETELNIRKSQEGNADTHKLDGLLQELMKSANIRSTDIKKANNSENKDTYGKWLEEIEEFEPAEYFEKRPIFEDFDKFLKYLKDWIYRPLKNLLSGSRDFNVEIKEEE
jgi:hypothetical protein